jgi:hypothetical protein
MEENEDPTVRREENAAADEAGSIGGRQPDYEGDEADRPLEEGGEGEAEGFELAERDLEETASHGEGRRSPEDDEFAAEERADAEFGEPDEVDPADR